MLVIALNIKPRSSESQSSESQSSESQSSGQVFEDVASSHWAYPYVTAAYEHGLVKGILGDDQQLRFGLGEDVSRQDMAVFIHRAFGEKMDAKDYSQKPHIIFDDLHQIAPYAVESIEKLTTVGILLGDSAGYLNPDQTASKAQYAKVLLLALLEFGN